MTRTIIPLLIPLLLLIGCMQEQNPVPEETLRHLVGTWQHSESQSTVRFYDDLSVKLMLNLPDKTQPFRLLSTLEMMKDDAIGISLGNAWRGPARITMKAPDTEEIVLHIPGEHKGEETTFRLRRLTSPATTR